MDAIQGAEDLTAARLIDEIRQGARFTAYACSLPFLTSDHPSPTRIQYLAPRISAQTVGLRYARLSLLLGWWGFLCGPFYTIGSLVQNLRGGTDLTQPILKNVEHVFYQGFANPEELQTLHRLAGEVGAG